MREMSRYPIEALRSFGQAVLVAVGVSRREAQIVADCLMDAQLRTAPFQNQGLIRLAIYARRIKEGGLRPGATIAIIRETVSTALLDGGNGFGQVVAHRAMTMAIEKARASGVGVVAARHSNHFGTASYFALMAAAAGLVGLALTNASPEMPAWGGSVPLVGTNPWSIAVPGRAGRPVVLDLSNAASGKGAIRHFAALGRALPPDWAIDPAGTPVTDARAAADALLAPMGGYKGYGIAVMVDLLTAGLAGGRAGSAVGSPYQWSQPQGVSHLLMALDPASFGGPNVLDAAVDTLSSELRGSPRQPGATATYLPGDPEWQRERDARQHGVELPSEAVEQLSALAVEAGVRFPDLSA
jgi:LDH2 family malate/lactate/ureidoglycolate dehydrogenase